MPARAPLLLPLPTGLCVSGITTLTLAIARASAARGRPVTLVLHPEPPGAAALDPRLPASVRVVDLRGLPPLQHADGDLSPWLPAYRAEVLDQTARHERPVVAFPNSIGDGFGLLAALTTEHARMLRVVGWQHNDIAYDTRVLEHYEPALTLLVAVSEHIRARLARRVPARAQDCLAIAAGVELPPRRPERPPGMGRPLRLLYTGRLDAHQKRTGALPLVSRLLDDAGIGHTLTVVGDGPGRDELIRIRARALELRPPVAPGDIPRLLDDADFFILPSRFEGLSVAMLEAMARGCVPVVTRVESGLSQVIRHGENGVIAEAGPGDDEPAAARAIARAVVEAAPRLDELSAAAYGTIARKFTLDRFADEVESAIELAAGAPPRAWPADRPAAFTARAGAGRGSGTVPADAPARLKAVLDGLAGRTVLIHGSGRHTLELADVLAEYKHRIVAFADDDPAAMGRTLFGLRVIAPPREAAAYARAHGATEVIISSFIHQDAIYARRGVYEAAGLNVRRLYG